METAQPNEIVESNYKDVFKTIHLFFLMSSPLWNNWPQHTDWYDWITLWFISTYPADISFIFDIQNFSKYMKWFSCTGIPTVKEGPCDIGMFSLNISGVETISASRTVLYCCWLSHFPADVYNLLIFYRHLYS